MTDERYYPTKTDRKKYIERSQNGPCFICRILDGDPDYPHHVVYEDDSAIVFLNKYPTLAGYTLVAPREHREEVTADFTEEEYLTLQRLIYRVAEAVRRETAAERVYILSLGSRQGNSHVHWHIAPLPPGVPYEQQQTEALDPARVGMLVISEEEMAALARRIGERVRTTPAD